MENRKSFILHFDSLDVIEELTDEQAGKLFKKMKSYHNGNTYDPKDKLIDILFIQFKNQFDRDIQKYDKTCERNKNNVGKRWNKEDTKNTTGISGINLDTKNTYNKNDSKNDNDNDNDSKNKSDSDKNSNLGNKEVTPLRKFNEEAVAVAIENRNVTQHLSICFFDLGYIPAKDETEESLREWISNIAKIKSKSGDEMIDIIHKWHAYWKGNKKQVKNHKASLLNQHSLKGN